MHILGYGVHLRCPTNASASVSFIKYPLAATPHQRKCHQGNMAVFPLHTHTPTGSTILSPPSYKSPDHPPPAPRSNSLDSNSSSVSQTSVSSGSSSENESRHGEEHKIPIDTKEYPRKRRRTTPNELYILETEFSKNSKPCREVRERIAKLTSMDEKAVQVWFQNKRQSCRRHMNQYQKPSQSENLFKGQVMRTNSFDNENNVGETALKRSKSLKLSMSADGKAEIVERSPLKAIKYNSQKEPLMRMARMPTYIPQIVPRQPNGVEAECANSLLVLKSGQWR